MKQKGKTWYTSKGEATLAKYLPPYEQACERIGQKVASTAEELEKRLSQAKYDLLRLCHEAYLEYLKSNQPVKRFSFTTFDKTHKIEFDVNEGYIRVYRATKKDPTHKDYQLINMDFSGASSQPLHINVPALNGSPELTEEEIAAGKRIFVPGINQGESSTEPIDVQEPSINEAELFPTQNP